MRGRGLTERNGNRTRSLNVTQVTTNKLTRTPRAQRCSVRSQSSRRIFCFSNSHFIVIGLTGGIATGKSTVSTLLKASNIPVVDADLIARQVVEPGTTALNRIKATFGNQVLFPDGTLDRKKLGSIIFTDESKRKKLNAIVHPAVRRTMLWQILRYWIRGYKYCVMDVPLLIEGGLWKWVGSVVVVYWYESLI